MKTMNIYIFTLNLKFKTVIIARVVESPNKFNYVKISLKPSLPKFNYCNPFEKGKHELLRK
jgi:hypothetical protein